ncbi:MAG: polysaccharide lyase [Nanoarchaeota archaeon]
MEKPYSKFIGFKDHKVGLYDIKTFVEDWGSEPRKGIKEKRCSIVNLKGERVLQITIPKGTESNGGSFWRLPFPKDLMKATFEYDIMFGHNFDFVRGGKLPGLGGGTSKGFGGTPEEYKNGFSARLMWREMDFNKGGALKKPLTREMNKLKELINLKAPKEKILDQLNIVRNELIKFEWYCRDLVKEPHKAFLVQYMYYPDRKSDRFGDNFTYKYKNKKVIVEPDKWYTIKMHIELSKHPQKKDTLLAWVNGKKVLSEKLNLRKKKSYGINQVMFSLFFGGNDETWHTKKDEKVYFRKFVINGK